MLVGRDRETKMTVSHVVPIKGGDQEWVAEKLTRDILQLGLQGDLTLRSELEPAIFDLLKQVAKLRECWKNLLRAITSGRLQSEHRGRKAVQSAEKARVHKLAFDKRIAQDCQSDTLCSLGCLNNYQTS